MAADETTVLKRVTEALNVCAPGTFSVTVASTNLDRNATAISECVREGAMLIGRAILANPAHVHRNLLVASSATTLTHQGELPDMSAELDLVQIQRYSGADWQTGVLRDAQIIESYRANPSSIYDSIAHNLTGSRLGGYYATANGRFYFTGFAARGYFPLISRTTITSLIPDEYETAWFMVAIGLALKEGDNLMPIAEYYMQAGMQDLAAISTMGVLSPMPPPETAQKVRGNI